MDLATWKTNAHKRLAALASTINDWAPSTLYGALTAMTLLPVVTSSDPKATLGALVGGVGLNLLTNQIEAWKTHSEISEQTLAAELTEQARNRPDFCAALDTVLEKLDALATVAQNLDADDREDNLKQIDRQLKKIGSRLTIGNIINLSIAGSADNANVIAGINNQIVNNQVYVAAEAFLQTIQTRLLPPAELQNATECYLTYLWDRYSILDIKGFGMADRVSLNLSLLEMYIPLKARIEVPEGETWAQHLRLAGRKVTSEEAVVMGERVSEPRPLLDLLAQQAGLIILGDPGAGKSTFLKYLALQLAQGQEANVQLDKRLPILIPLAAYADAIAQRDIALQDFLGEYYRKQGLAELQIDGLLKAALENGRALLLFDGLDEVQQAEQRATVVRRVEGFFALHRKRGNKFILTSRIVGYRDAPLTASGVQTCTLVDFDDADMADFVEKWSHVIEKAVKGDNAVTRQAAEIEKAELLDALRRNEGVRQLAANPLLLTILALMKRQNVTLPERRVQLYEKYVETLLNSWNLARSLDRHHGGPHMETGEVLKVLAPLALWMQTSSPGQGLVKQPAALRQLAEIYRRRAVADPERAAQQLLAHARDYASLLLERGAGQYGFIHLTFMEYLAAIGLAMLGQQNIDPVVEQLAQHVAESTWHEVTLLTIGYMGIVQARDEAASDVVLKLLESQAGAPGAVVVLAGEAVIDARPDGVTQHCQQTVIDALLRTMIDAAQVQPPLRAAAGRVLAKLGDPRPAVNTIQDMEFCYVPAGPFEMGSEDDPEAYADEKPRHTYDIPYDYWISRYPITNAQFAAFVKDGGYANPAYWSEAKQHGVWADGYVMRRIATGYKDGKYIFKKERERANAPVNYVDPYSLPNHPVVGITWYEALAFARWLTAKLNHATFLPQGWSVGLPSEAEWEKAARGGHKIPKQAIYRSVAPGLPASVKCPLVKNHKLAQRYAWGDKPDANRMNYAETKIETTNAVGCFPGGISPYGVEELSGNVWEWTRSLWGEDALTAAFGYPYQPNDGREKVDTGTDVRRVVRGGSFDDLDNVVRAAVRFRNLPVYWRNDVGLRLVLSPSTSGV